MLRRSFSKRTRDEIAYCHRLLHIPYNEPEVDSKVISEIGSSIVSKKYSSVSKPPQHWRKGCWQDLRNNSLTASAFSRAIGFWPESRKELWLEKIGVSKPFSANRATFWDNGNEYNALERYTELTGNDILMPEFVVHRNEAESWLGASPDGLVKVVKDGVVVSNGVLEVKCSSRNDVPCEKVPWRYVPQLQGLMEIVGTEWLDLYCWTRKGSSLFRVSRDVEFWEDMKPALVDFWQKHVLPAREIYNDIDVKDPNVEIREFMPESRHEDCEKIICGAKRISETCNRLFYEIDGELVD